MCTLPAGLVSSLLTCVLLFIRDDNYLLIDARRQYDVDLVTADGAVVMSTRLDFREHGVHTLVVRAASWSPCLPVVY